MLAKHHVAPDIFAPTLILIAIRLQEYLLVFLLGTYIKFLRLQKDQFHILLKIRSALRLIESEREDIYLRI
jgi:hypothetical protein